MLPNIKKKMGLFQASPTKPIQFLPEIASTNPFQSSLVSLNPQMVKNTQNQIPESNHQPPNHPTKIVKETLRAPVISWFLPSEYL